MLPADFNGKLDTQQIAERATWKRNSKLGPLKAKASPKRSSSIL